MEPITKADFMLINDLSSRSYSDNKLSSNAQHGEIEKLKIIISKLKRIADYFSQKYYDAYGPFEVSVTTGNPIAIGGIKLKRIWSGIFKGASNKQYAAQVSFVMNSQETCLDVGFYFGRASAHKINRDQKIKFEDQLNQLGHYLSDIIIDDRAFNTRYNYLFDYGFLSYSDNRIVASEEWINIIRTKAKNSQIIAKIYPNNFDIIENSTIDAYVSQVIFLMGGVGKGIRNQPAKIKPFTIEQIKKIAERLAEIGINGELFVMQYEKKRLGELGNNKDGYPKHVALDSMHHGYDILSLDESGKEIFIEVKTTTRTKDDKYSRRFYISLNEYDKYQEYKKRYKLYRVYDIENVPSLEILDLEHLEKTPDGYTIKY